MRAHDRPDRWHICFFAKFISRPAVNGGIMKEETVTGVTLSAAARCIDWPKERCVGLAVGLWRVGDNSHVTQ